MEGRSRCRSGQRLALHVYNALQASTLLELRFRVKIALRTQSQQQGALAFLRADATAGTLGPTEARARRVWRAHTRSMQALASAPSARAASILERWGLQG